MIFDEKKVIFMHYPKTGGNSIQDALREHASDKIAATANHQDGFERFEVRNEKYKNLVKHSSLQDYYDAIGRDILNYKVYVTIRNPFDRLVSFYFSPHRGDVRYERNDFAQFIGKIASLEEFIYLKKESVFSRKKMFENVRFLKFENLNEDFFRLTSELNLKGINLPHRNKSKRKDYKLYYDDELIEMVRMIFKFEMSFGDYSF